MRIVIFCHVCQRDREDHGQSCPRRREGAKAPAAPTWRTERQAAKPPKEAQGTLLELPAAGWGSE